MRDVVAGSIPTTSTPQTMYAESLMDLRPWNYWTGDGRPYPGTEEIVATLEKVLARNPNHPGSEPPLHPRRGGDEEPGAGGGRGGPAAEAHARRRPHGPHAVAHLPARGPLRRRRGVERGGGQGGRGLHQPVPRPGPLPDGLLPAQHPLPLVRGHRRGPEPGGHRGRPQDRRPGDGREARRAAAPRRLPRGALLRARPLREVGRDARGAGARRRGSST